MNTLRYVIPAAMSALPVLSAEAEPAPIPVNLKVGEQISVVLNGNPTTGYIWRVDGKIPAKSPVQVELVNAAQQDDSFCCGFPVPTTLNIIGRRAGKTTVRVVYARPWEKGKAPADVKTFAVKVTTPAK
ncbi:MAG: protease inhibitor I42 family protein [Akkermansia sp.]|nr:protease inhibitor I42 family protein [Akkermansia sp.]